MTNTPSKNIVPRIPPLKQLARFPILSKPSIRWKYLRSVFELFNFIWIWSYIQCVNKSEQGTNCIWITSISTDISLWWHYVQWTKTYNNTNYCHRKRQYMVITWKGILFQLQNNGLAKTCTLQIYHLTSMACFQLYTIIIKCVVICNAKNLYLFIS